MLHESQSDDGTKSEVLAGSTLVDADKESAVNILAADRDDRIRERGEAVDSAALSDSAIFDSIGHVLIALIESIEFMLSLYHVGPAGRPRISFESGRNRISPAQGISRRCISGHRHSLLPAAGRFGRRPSRFSVLADVPLLAFLFNVRPHGHRVSSCRSLVASQIVHRIFGAHLAPIPARLSSRT